VSTQPAHAPLTDAEREQLTRLIRRAAAGLPLADGNRLLLLLGRTDLAGRP